jgi:hypothetical protein
LQLPSFLQLPSYYAQPKYWQNSNIQYRKKPPQRILKWPLPSKAGTYCTHLAGFYEDDMSPWVLSSILIQRGLHFGLQPAWTNQMKVLWPIRRLHWHWTNEAVTSLLMSKWRPWNSKFSDYYACSTVRQPIETTLFSKIPSIRRRRLTPRKKGE